MIANCYGYEYPGIYRGTVVFNVDPDVQGKLKIFVHGVYPDEYFDKHLLLPWAEPAMSLFGGNWTNELPDEYGNHLNELVGWCTVPHQGKQAATGSQVYVFFENNDINKPVYFAAAQSALGWFSEHPNQHVFRSDNVQIRIDEDTSHPDSTCKFDTYNDKNNDMSIHDGTKKDVETRIDIQVLAQSLNAVNVQISGNVNMKIIGDWYVHHEGDKHLTHIGNLYGKHIGNTYIEQEGNYNFKHVGKTYSEYIEALKSLTVVGNVYKTVTLSELKNIFENYDTKVGANYDRYIKGDSHYTVVGNNVRLDLQDDTLKVAGNTDVTIGKNLTAIIGNEGLKLPGNATVTVAHNIITQSVKGNIDINTLGQFELLNSDGIVTADGYNNIGTKGNIRLTSTLGNIALQTVNNPLKKPGLTLKTTVIPWNPVFLSNVSMISMIFADFDPKKALFMNLNSICNISSVVDILNFLTALPTTVIYDGLPTYFPCRMINQNPNTKPVDQVTWMAGEYKNFSSEELNWQKITNESYWKVVGRLIGNIDIDSWSGDINLTTHGRLGNAGNINISANDLIGSLSTNKKGSGNVNISNQSKFRIYTDPRNMFFDSSSIINRLTILSNGSGSTGSVFGCLNMLKQKDTAGGCASCIADAVVDLLKNMGLLGVDDLKLLNNSIPLHPINGTKPMNSLFYDNNVTTEIDNAMKNIDMTAFALEISKKCLKYANSTPTSVFELPDTILSFKTDLRTCLKKGNFPKEIISNIMLLVLSLLPEIEIDPSDLEAPAKYADLLTSIPFKISECINNVTILLNQYTKKEQQYLNGCSLALFDQKTNGIGHAIDNNITDINFTTNFGSININSYGAFHQTSQNNYTVKADTKYSGHGYEKNISVTPYFGFSGVLKGISWSPASIIPKLEVETIPKKGLTNTILGYEIVHKENMSSYYSNNLTVKQLDLIVRNNPKKRTFPFSGTVDETIVDTNRLTYKLQFDWQGKIGNDSININSRNNTIFGIKITDEDENPYLYVDPYNKNGNDAFSDFNTPSISLKNFQKIKGNINTITFNNNYEHLATTDGISIIASNVAINDDYKLVYPLATLITGWEKIATELKIRATKDLQNATYTNTLKDYLQGNNVNQIYNITGKNPTDVPLSIKESSVIKSLNIISINNTNSSKQLYITNTNTGSENGTITNTNSIGKGTINYNDLSKKVNKNTTAEESNVIFSGKLNLSAATTAITFAATTIKTAATNWTVAALEFISG